MSSVAISGDPFILNVEFSLYQQCLGSPCFCCAPPHSVLTASSRQDLEGHNHLGEVQAVHTAAVGRTGPQRDSSGPGGNRSTFALVLWQTFKYLSAVALAGFFGVPSSLSTAPALWGGVHTMVGQCLHTGATAASQHLNHVRISVTNSFELKLILFQRFSYNLCFQDVGQMRASIYIIIIIIIIII